MRPRGEQLRSLRGHDNAVMPVSWSPDGVRLASGSLDKDGATMERVNGDDPTPLRGHSELVNAVCFSSDGKQLTSGLGSADATVRNWNPAARVSLSRAGTDHDGRDDCDVSRAAQYTIAWSR